MPVKQTIAPGLSALTVRRVRQLARHLETKVKPARFHMGSYFLRRRRKSGEGWCGTAACLAGHVALLRGLKPVWNKSDDVPVRPGGSQAADYCKNGQEREVFEVGQEWLGINRQQAEVLFYPWLWPEQDGYQLFDEKNPKSAAQRLRFFLREGR